MRKLIAVALTTMLASTAAFAADYNLRLEHLATDTSGDTLYESSEGYIVRTAKGCEVPEYQVVRLSYFGNPWPSNYGPSVDSLFYNQEVPETIDTVYFDGDGNEIVVSEFTGEFVEETVSCFVTGVIGLEHEPVVSNYDVIFDKVSNTLDLRNIHLSEGTKLTGEVIESALLGNFNPAHNSLQILEVVE